MKALLQYADVLLFFAGVIVFVRWQLRRPPEDEPDEYEPVYYRRKRKQQ
ncbi:MAG: hypothetical protein KDE54_00510 [Caldilineaceae bacterium]|nr:hypothetical protein [Caldilineaceae bacterium]MCB0143827.1 hypothetical protein [Caldilineaceae bacterium]